MNDLVLTDRAALALIDEAERALAAVDNPEDADDLWRRVKAVEEAARLARVSEATLVTFRRVQLRAKRRYGELLGPAENRGPATVTASDGSTSRERESRSRARKLAAVPEPVFNAHLEQSDPDKLSEAGVIREARRLDRPAPKPVPAAEGTFSVLYADPPWRYEHNETPDLRAVENQYPTMTAEEIAALDVPAASDAVLFLWATNPKLIEALAVMDAWGFDYRTNACWVKDRFGMGYYVRGQHELLLIGKRGEIRAPEPADRPSSVLAADRREHSRKPDEFYDLIERMYPEHSKVELFARRPRGGWESWGNQLAEAA